MASSPCAEFYRQMLGYQSKEMLTRHMENMLWLACHMARVIVEVAEQFVVLKSHCSDMTLLERSKVPARADAPASHLAIIRQ